MKNLVKQLAIIALVAVIGLSFTACPDGGGGGGGGGGPSNPPGNSTSTAPAITTTSLPSGAVGTVYSQTLAAAGETPITWSRQSGSLPNGLSLSSAGVISGTPTVANTFNFTVKATNAKGDGTQSLSITIAPSGAPTVTTASLPNGLWGTAYNQTLAAAGDTPITWSVNTGSLPNGLSLSSAGAITGNPTTAGTFNFSVRATNAKGNGTKSLSITIAPHTPHTPNTETGLCTACNALTYNLGDTGPCGGKIFYRLEAGFTMTDNSQVCHYLEAAPADMTYLRWASSSYQNTAISGTGEAIGTGRKNTALILATDVNAPAAKACKDYSNGGKTDWFLPSLRELAQLNVNRASVGNMGTTDYWSSSQVSGDAFIGDAFILNSSGGLSSEYKGFQHTVRAVRAF